MVGVGDLAVVRDRLLYLLAEGRGRLVGQVRIEQVDPEEVRLAGLRVQPGERARDHFAGAAVRVFVHSIALGRLGHLVVIDGEALAEAEGSS